jgi:hypothetical protein
VGDATGLSAAVVRRADRDFTTSLTWTLFLNFWTEEAWLPGSFYFLSRQRYEDRCRRTHSQRLYRYMSTFPTVMS